ncbi:MAG TPA: endonuclease/exonuclease/phosphatase family protein [Candidatus Paceibacterota bacterium]|nr:endonuclease/exonuclease/phosphatase family protein [Candidatus Paceibacterota bacterium]
MRLTSWNLLHGRATPLTSASENARSGSPAEPNTLLANALRTLNPDVLGLQEVDFHLARSADSNQVAAIASMMGAQHWAFTPSVIGSPDENWRGTTQADVRVVTNKNPIGLSGYGIGLVSKVPIRSWHRLELPAAPIGVLMTLPREGKLKKIYVRDHPRSALAAELENGWLIINTHLTFVPVFNYLQLLKIKRWVKRLPATDKSKIIIMGDLNLPLSILVRGLHWNSLVTERTFPTWKPRVQVDYFLSQKISPEDVVHVPSMLTGVSDHLPLTVELD